MSDGNAVLTHLSAFLGKKEAGILPIRLSWILSCKEISDPLAQVLRKFLIPVPINAAQADNDVW